MKIDKKEKAVVVIGSGPGGAQVAYQLTKQGIHVVTGQKVRGCGCRLAAKALSPGSVCPLGKW